MRRLFQTIIGRLAVLTILVAITLGAIWSWHSLPLSLLEHQYFWTESPDSSALRRGGQTFDINNPYHRSLLVSGPGFIPFGVRPQTNVHITERGMLDSSVHATDVRLYREYCGFPLDQNPKDRAIWRGVVLCNAAKLDGEILNNALREFHAKVDEEIARHRLAIIKNIGDKFGKCLLGAFGIVLISAAAMWVTKGKLV